MQIKKDNLGLVLQLADRNFLLNPSQVRTKENYTLIFSQYNEKINYDQIFASPGEYNVGEVFIYSFLNKNNQLTHLFESDEGFLIFSNVSPEAESFKKIKEITSKIEALIFLDKNLPEELIKKFEIKNIITDHNLNYSNFQKNKGKSFKINLKRSENQIYILE
ncbi:hypothetical protein HRbin35_00470 [bacterium HR35]|nr:hypothetical protein HRbin35_00470 [bacterium HR35]